MSVVIFITQVVIYLTGIIHLKQSVGRTAGEANCDQGTGEEYGDKQKRQQHEFCPSFHRCTSDQVIQQQSAAYCTQNGGDNDDRSHD